MIKLSFVIRLLRWCVTMAAITQLRYDNGWPCVTSETCPSTNAWYLNVITQLRNLSVCSPRLPCKIEYRRIICYILSRIILSKYGRIYVNQYNTFSSVTLTSLFHLPQNYAYF